MKFFGTDGFRGRANDGLTAQQAFQVGSCLGYLLRQDDSRPEVLIGKDTRISSTMFEYALAAGLSAHGCDVLLLGVVPTPMVAYETLHSNASAAVMISASHNPYYDNGIKLFDSQGMKMNGKVEQQIESYLEGQMDILLPDNDSIGLIQQASGSMEHYLHHLKEISDFDLSSYKVVLDCANGAAYQTARKAFEQVGAEVIVINDQPDGFNINNQCGSTHPQELVQRVLEEKADFGFAFDGDADRCIGVDHTGELVDGDKILYACGLFMREQGALQNNLIVTTIMANMGLFKKLKELNIKTEVTQVGDKHVYEAMLTKDSMLGGEQSGHIIFRELFPSGDGVLTALKLAEVVVKTNKSLHDITKDLIIYPQTLKNVVVHDKEKAMSHVDVRKKMSEIDHRLGDSGRLLVRPSGTEPLVRVMVEAKTKEMSDAYVDEVVEVIVSKNL